MFHNDGGENNSSVEFKMQDKRGGFNRDIQYWESLDNKYLYQETTPVIRYYMVGHEFKPNIMVSRRMYFGDDKNKIRPVQHPENLEFMFNEDPSQKLSLEEYFYLEPVISGLRQYIFPEDYDLNDSNEVNEYNTGILIKIKEILDEFGLSGGEIVNLLNKLWNLHLDGGKYNSIIIDFADNYDTY